MLTRQRTRFKTLDSFRGVAALVVVWHHTRRVVGFVEPTFSYLAVDLFFIMSGFVLAHNYDDRFAAGYTARQFMIARFIRLYPLYAAGLAISSVNLLIFVGRYEFPVLAVEQISQNSAALALLFNCFGLPAPIPGLTDPFPLNRAAWSLFFEFWVANLVYAFFWSFLRGTLLVLVIIISLAGFVIGGYIFETTNIGWNWDNFFGGFPRLFYTFFLGVALSRVARSGVPVPSLPSWFLVGCLLLMLSLPIHGRFALAYSFLCIIFLFPILIYSGVHAMERRPELGALLGDLSYAAYIIHAPLLLPFYVYSQAYGLRPSIKTQFVFVVLIIFASLLLHAGDTRGRRALNVFLDRQRRL
jgi:peptidoglycan/LPS O-acetylase OafA/YrhL